MTLLKRLKKFFIDGLYSNIPVTTTQPMLRIERHMQTTFLAFTLIFVVPKATNKAKIPNTSLQYLAM